MFEQRPNIKFLIKMYFDVRAVTRYQVLYGKMIFCNAKDEKGHNLDKVRNHLRIPAGLYVKYYDPSSSNSQNISFIRFHMVIVQKYKKGHNSVSAGLNQ